MLRKHNTTLEYLEEQDTYMLDVDGYTTYLTRDDMISLTGYMMEDDIKATEDITSFLKEKDPNLYQEKLTPLADNPNAYDVYDILKCQFEKPVYTQKPSR